MRLGSSLGDYGYIFHPWLLHQCHTGTEEILDFHFLKQGEVECFVALCDLPEALPFAVMGVWLVQVGVVFVIVVGSEGMKGQIRYFERLMLITEMMDYFHLSHVVLMMIFDDDFVIKLRWTVVGSG